MSWYIWAKLRPSAISNCSSPCWAPVALPVYFSSWSPMPVETPAETLVAAIFTMPSRNRALSREETVIPAKGRKRR